MFTFRSKIPCPVEQVFQWHQQPGALERLLPPWEHVCVEQKPDSIAPGSCVVLKMSLAGIPIRWVAEHTELDLNHHFKDKQVSGPFAKWEHTHRFSHSEGNECILVDEIDFEIPGGKLGDRLARGQIQHMLLQMFRYRHETTTHDMIAHQRFKDQAPMKIAITGGTGLVGSQLIPFLTTGGHQVSVISRTPGENTIQWDIKNKEIELEKLEGFDAIIHLAGESLASGRWNDSKKQAIRDSRVDGTQFLCEQLAKLKDPPRTFICASASGFYGDRGEEVLNEQSPPGEGFLPEVCVEWEKSAQPAMDAGIRTVFARLSMVLSPKGGALAEMLTPFKLGAGAKLGAGNQFWSWVSIDDVVGSLHHMLMCQQIEGPVNVCAPCAIRNRDFTKILGKVLNRPTILTVPQFAARMGLGQMADDLLFASFRMEPGVLTETGYGFRDPDLERALRKLLGKQIA